MCYRVAWTGAAKHQLKSADRGLKSAVNAWGSEIEGSDNPLGVGDCTKLQRRANAMRWRLGRYRVLADVDKDGKTVTVFAVSARGDAYKTIANR